MDSIVLREYDIQATDMSEMIDEASRIAKYASLAIEMSHVDEAAEWQICTLHFLVGIALTDLGNALSILSKEACRRESEKEALEEIRAAETPEGKAAQVEEAKRVLPHMMEQLVANLRAECSGKEGAA